MIIDNFSKNDYEFFYECIYWINNNLKNGKINKPIKPNNKFRYDENNKLLNFNEIYLKRNAKEIIESGITLGCSDNAIVLQYLLTLRKYKCDIISKFKMKTFSGLFWNHTVCIVNIKNKKILIDPTFSYISDYDNDKLFKNKYKLSLPFKEINSLKDNHCFILKRLEEKYKNFNYKFNKKIKINFNKDFLIIAQKILNEKPFIKHDSFEIYERILMLKELLNSKNIKSKILSYGYCVDANLEFNVIHFLNIDNIIVDIINLKVYNKELIKNIWIGENKIPYKDISTDYIFNNTHELVEFYLKKLGINNCH